MNPNSMTFSQAYGYEELPGPLNLEELPPKARTRIWNLFHDAIHDKVWFDPDGVPRIDDFTWRDILWSVHRDHFVRAVDDWPDGEWHFLRPVEFRRDIEELPFNEVFDLIQFVLRHDRCPPSLATAMKAVFAESRLAYTIDEGPPSTIIPAVTPEEGIAIVASMRSLRKAGLNASESHLRKASSCINQGDWAGSIRESIHAVESVARVLDPAASRTLEPALQSLERHRPLHGALKGGFSKLYGYTSDEQGIRHALLDRADANVGSDEALFMFGACASFASFLWRKNNSAP